MRRSASSLLTLFCKVQHVKYSTHQKWVPDALENIPVLDKDQIPGHVLHGTPLLCWIAQHAEKTNRAPQGPKSIWVRVRKNDVVRSKLVNVTDQVLESLVKYRLWIGHHYPWVLDLCETFSLLQSQGVVNEVEILGDALVDYDSFRDYVTLVGEYSSHTRVGT